VTLLELLVAMAIFLFLGAALITMLRQGIATWRSGESRREIYERAREILGQISSDLSSTYTVKVQEDQPFDIMFVCDWVSSAPGACHSQRLRFVRTLSGAGSDYALQEAGTLLGADSDLDLVNDGSEARVGLLRSTGGLCEVAYVSDPVSETLHRAMRAPIGGARSLFCDANVQVSAATSRLIEFASGVMFLGFSFWTQYTNTWDENSPTLISPRENQKSGPLLWWDSTRSTLPPALFGAPERDEYTLFRSASSLTDPSDDAFPREVRITLVISEKGTEGQTTLLKTDISADTLHIPVENVQKLPGTDSAFPYAKIGAEWIRYSKIEGDMLILDEYGRGRRGTQPASHNRGTPVRAGLTFVTTVRVPGFREDWNDR
jgi:hypothetical protein